jgi:hypothetical protein
LAGGFLAGGFLAGKLEPLTGAGLTVDTGPGFVLPPGLANATPGPGAVGLPSGPVGLTFDRPAFANVPLIAFQIPPSEGCVCGGCCAGCCAGASFSISLYIRISFGSIFIPLFLCTIYLLLFL